MAFLHTNKDFRAASEDFSTPTEKTLAGLFDFGLNKARFIAVNGPNQECEVSLTVVNTENKTVLECDDIHGDDYGLLIRPQMNLIYVKEVRAMNNNGDCRRNGLGKAFIAGLVRVAETVGIDNINLTAGREDGMYFWSRHGWRLLDDQQAGKFCNDINRKLETAGHEHFSDDQIDVIRKLIHRQDLYVNQRLAELPLTQEQINFLFAGEIRMGLNLKDDRCLKRLKQGFDRGMIRTDHIQCLGKYKTAKGKGVAASISQRHLL
tara:strand:+ start:110 stop:898 length:789 start_codon:yes stop_codon:yes gene_type:complete